MTIWNELGPQGHSLEYVDVDGVRTRSLRAGNRDGAAVLMLHGTSGHLEAFSRNVVAHGSYDIHAIDMLGHGYTDKPDKPYEIRDYVSHMIGYLDAVGVDKVHIIGESLGGWVGARAAIDFPDRVMTLQLLCSGGTVANPEVMERIKSSTRRAVMSGDIDLTRQRLRLLMASEEDATEELVEVRHAIYQAPDFIKNIDNLLGLQEMDRRRRNLLTPEDLGSITQPTLVVWGRNNPFGEVPEASEMSQNIPGSRLVLFDECGHWPQHEQAAKYNELSLDFLASN